jgi:hypothetical protein
MDLCALLLTLGAPLGPFIMGFVVSNAGLHWVFWTFAIMNFYYLQGCFLLNAETQHVPHTMPPLLLVRIRCVLGVYIFAALSALPYR